MQARLREAAAANEALSTSNAEAQRHIGDLKSKLAQQVGPAIVISGLALCSGWGSDWDDRAHGLLRLAVLITKQYFCRVWRCVSSIECS